GADAPFRRKKSRSGPRYNAYNEEIACESSCTALANNCAGVVRQPRRLPRRPARSASVSVPQDRPSEFSSVIEVRLLDLQRRMLSQVTEKVRGRQRIQRR